MRNRAGDTTRHKKSNGTPAAGNERCERPELSETMSNDPVQTSPNSGPIRPTSPNCCRVRAQFGQHRAFSTVCTSFMASINLDPFLNGPAGTSLCWLSGAGSAMSGLGLSTRNHTFQDVGVQPTTRWHLPGNFRRVGCMRRTTIKPLLVLSHKAKPTESSATSFHKLRWGQ